MVSLPSFLRPWRRRAPAIPAVRLAGVIGSVGLAGRGLTLAGLERTLDAAFAHRHAPAVALLINSPGGSPVQSALIAGRIRDLAQEKGKPVLAFVEDVAASGGYWLACAADEIWADPSSIVGSIGVISAGFGFEEAIGRLGIERRVHATGERKALLDPFRAERPGDLELLREIQGDILARFTAHVRERRGERLKGSDAELFDGRVWTGDGALSHGLIDGLGEARTTIRARFGKEARLVVANPRRGLLRRLRLRSGPAHILDDALAVLEARPLAPVRIVAAGAVGQMFSLSFGKILVTVLVVVAAWRGWRLYQQMQARLAAANERAAHPAPAAKSTDLVECVRCGLFVPNGTICRSVDQCQFRST